MRTTGDDGRPGAGGGRPGSARRAAGLALGCGAAVAATAVVFLSDDPQVLRIAVVSVAWACLLAAFATARPARDDAERTAAPASGPDVRAGSAREAEPRVTHAREADLRAAHARELDALRDAERARSDEVRRDAEAGVRRELDALRAELAGLREGLSGLDALRSEVAAVGALHGELRGDLAELGALRTDLGRLRTELTDRLAGELSGELRLERVVVHAQSVRTGPGREPLGPATAWEADVARELTGSRPAAPAPSVTAATVTAATSPARPGGDARPVPQPLSAVPVPPTRRHTDPPADPSAPATYERATVQRPAVHAAAAGHAGPPAHPAPPVHGDPGADRLAQILAESGVRPGGRRRRYRD